MVYFELNGQSKEIVTKDTEVETLFASNPVADKNNSKHIAATMPGTIVDVICEKEQEVKKGDYLIITEAMKMETTVQVPFGGVIKEI